MRAILTLQNLEALLSIDGVVLLPFVRLLSLTAVLVRHNHVALARPGPTLSPMAEWISVTSSRRAVPRMAVFFHGTRWS